MQSEVHNLNALRLIRTVKDLNQEEFAGYFLCTKAYISAVEHGKRQMTFRTLKSGLTEMQISVEGYFELEKLRDYMLEMNMDSLSIYRCMLAKTIGLVNPDLEEQAELLVAQILNKKSRQR